MFGLLVTHVRLHITRALAPQLVEDIENGAEKWDVTDDRFDNEDLIEREASMGRSNFMFAVHVRH